MLTAGAWLSTRLLVTREVSLPETTAQRQETFFFEYVVAAEPGHIRISGTTTFPNGVILVGTLDKIGRGPIEVKEALVMNRLFALEFGPELSVQYYLRGSQDALQAGVYRISVEFDPAQQSPFVQEALLRWSEAKSSPMPSGSAREIDQALIRVSRTFAIGTLDEQQRVQMQDQEYRQTVTQHLRETLGALSNLWRLLRTHYQQERLKGGVQADQQGDEWHTWHTQWRNDLIAIAEKGRLDDVVSPASPLLSARDALMGGYKQLALLSDLYLEVLTNERSVTDRDLQRAEQAVQHALTDAGIQLGQPEKVLPPAKRDEVKPSIVVTAALANLRSGPGMDHAAIGQVRKDVVLDLLGEQGEWFQVQLSGNHTGWVHRNVASKHPQADGTTGQLKRVETKPVASERPLALHLEPINLLATSIEYIPPPTSDEVKIYGELEAQLRDLQVRSADERKTSEHGILQRASEKFGISPAQVWSTYLKVQGWEIKQ
ncbi:MAG: SH3 domain-containing protein [Candidatus Tectomicrobia bacterium]|nr:SH3 domain-containing protein [Candidatus Tectomicrobia bacterium]